MIQACLSVQGCKTGGVHECSCSLLLSNYNTIQSYYSIPYALITATGSCQLACLQPPPRASLKNMQRFTERNVQKHAWLHIAGKDAEAGRNTVSILQVLGRRCSLRCYDCSKLVQDVELQAVLFAF